MSKINLLDIFKEVAREEVEDKLKKQLDRVNKECLDVIIEEKYNIKSDKKYNYRLRKKIDNDIKYKNVIVIVLESPHKDEYTEYEEEEGKKLYDPVSAVGKTGENITKYLNEIINSIVDKNEDKDYCFILMNAIQFPCSLFYSTNIYRDDIFTGIWNKKHEDEFIYRNDFFNRLKNYNPKIIINACTKGKVGLQKKVQDEIDKYKKEIKDEDNKDIYIYQINHPSIWSIKKNRKPYRIKE